jgi:YHS domain-containing protein
MNYQTLLGWAVIAAILWFMMRRGGCCGGSAGKQDASQQKGESAVDPICGMTVQKSTALKATVDGQDYFFCSPACRDEFLKGKGAGHGGHDTPGHQGHCC